MGRGRAKAKQTKVARDLKYRSYSTDFASLERELRGNTDAVDEADDTAGTTTDNFDDDYADLADRYLDQDDIHRIG